MEQNQDPVLPPGVINVRKQSRWYSRLAVW